ncbi:MAG: alpha-amylase [Paludibacteraceae bacterium]|nr:alpha-amylase [Paludibacteraceae bacterium]
MKINNILMCVLCLALVLLSGCRKGPQVLPPNMENKPVEDANTMVIYECNERLFAEQDAFKTIEAYIPTLKDMGVDVLWLMPIHPRGADEKAIGSPYCVQNYRAIDPAFGTMADLQQLVATAHKNDMRVILDWIANHTSWDNAWVKTHPDWYQGPQTADEQAWSDVTFLNYSIQAVCDTMQECMLYWVDNADIDGFRCDYAGGAPLDFWKSVNQEIKSRKQNALMLAETSDARHYAAGFNLLYSWSFMYAVEGLYSGSGTFGALLSANTSEYNSTPADGERMRYITTHDESATHAPASFYRTAEGELSAFCLTAFMAGVPMIYSSQELGYLNTINFFNYNIMDFASDNPTRNALKSILSAYHSTAHLRGGIRNTGSLNAKVPYIEYSADGETMIVICNTANSEQEVKYPMKHQGHTVTDLLHNEQLTLGTTAVLAPYEYRIYKH